MSPFDQIAAKYAEHPQARSFAFYVDWHMRHGFVFSRPDFFIMGRPVRKSEGLAGIEAFTERGNDRSGLCDTWYIHAMAGDMCRAWDVLPWPLGWLAWERVLDGKRELRFYSTEEVRRLCVINPAA